MTVEMFESLTEGGALAAQVETELGEPLEASTEESYEESFFRLSVTHPIDITNPATEEEQLRWAHRAANVFVNALRPRLQMLAKTHGLA